MQARGLDWIDDLPERGMAGAYISGLRFASGHDRDQLADESLPCRLTADAVWRTA